MQEAAGIRGASRFFHAYGAGSYSPCAFRIFVKDVSEWRAQKK